MEPLHPNLKIKEIKWFRQKDDGMVGRVEDPDPMALMEVGGGDSSEMHNMDQLEKPLNTSLSGFRDNINKLLLLDITCLSFPYKNIIDGKNYTGRSKECARKVIW